MNDKVPLRVGNIQDLEIRMHRRVERSESGRKTIVKSGRCKARPEWTVFFGGM